MVYRHGLGPCVERRGSSSLPSGTHKLQACPVESLQKPKANGKIIRGSNPVPGTEIAAFSGGVKAVSHHECEDSSVKAILEKMVKNCLTIFGFELLASFLL